MNLGVKISLFIIAGVASFALGVFGNYELNLKNKVPPETQIATAIGELLKASTVGYESEFLAQEILAPTSTEKAASLVLKFKGSSDTTVIENPKTTFDASFNIPEKSGFEAFLGPGTIQMEVRTLSKALYLNLKQFPKAFIDVAPILNTWLKIDLGEYAQQLTQSTSTIAFNKKTISDFTNDLIKAGFFKVTKTHASENIGGALAYHHSYIIDKERVLAFFPRYEAFLIQLDPTQAPRITSELARQKVQLEKVSAEHFPYGEIWINSTNLQLAKIKIEKKISHNEALAQYSEGIHFSLSTTFSNIGQPITIEAPSPTITIKEAYEIISKAAEAAFKKAGQENDSTGPYGQQFAQARNTQRSANINALLNGIGQNMADNRGVFTCPTKLPSVAKNVSSKAGDLDIASCLVPTYLPSMPFDPAFEGAHWFSASDYNTGYTIAQQNGDFGRVTVAAPYAELGQSIHVTR